MKAYIICDEHYPIFSLYEKEQCWSKEIEVPEELLREYQEVLTAYDKIQNKLSALYFKSAIKR